MTDTQFTAVAPFYDELMAGVPYKIWVRYVQEILDQLDFRPERVLELACGTGTVAMLMAGLGYKKVVGVDFSEPMIEMARFKAETRGVRAEFHVGDLRTLDLPEKDFDLELCLFDSYNYILDPEELGQVMTRSAEHLREGGLLIFDVNTVTALAGELFTQESLAANAEPKYIWTSKYNPETRISRVDMKFISHGREYFETHFQRAYGLDELQMLLKKAGFHVVCVYDAFTFRRPLRRSDRVYFVARKRRG